MDTNIAPDTETWFAQLLANHWDRTVRTAYAAVRAYPDAQDPQGAAEDAAQEAFLLGWQRLAELRATTSPEAWLRGVAWNIARRLIERQRRQERLLSATVAEADEAAALTKASDDRDNGGQEVMADMGLDSLQPQQREILYLHYIAEYSTEEIARLLAISPATSRQRLSRARRAARTLQPWKTVAVPAVALLLASAADAAHADIGQQMFDRLAAPPSSPPPSPPPSATTWLIRGLGVATLTALIGLAIYVVSRHLAAPSAARAETANRVAQFANAVVARTPWSGVAAATPGAEATPGELGSIEGFVVDADDLPVGGAEVIISTKPRRTATSEADGWFSFHDVPLAAYGIAAHKDAAYAESVSVTARRQGAPIKLVLAAGSSLVVRVVDAAGAPLPQASVSLSSGLREETRAVDELGQFQFDGLDYGWTQVEALAPGFATGISMFNSPGHPGAVAYAELVLQAGTPQDGRVVDESGRPVADADVTLAIVGETPLARQQVKTDAQGMFRFAATAPGRYQVGAKHAAFGQSVGQIEALPQPNLTLTLRRGTTLRGKVVDNQGGPARAAVVYFARGMSTDGSTTTDSDGHFSYEIFGDGLALVSALTADAVSEIQTVEVAAQASRELALVLQAGVIAGRVVDPSGRPVEHARVVATPDPMSGLGENATPEAYEAAMDAVRREFAIPTPMRAATDADGRFAISPLRSGAYNISASSAGALGIYSYLDDAAATFATVGATDVEIVLRGGSDVGGRVVDAAGAPLSEISASIAPEAGSLGYATPMTIRTTAGTFWLKDVPPGRAVLAISGAGFARKLIDIEVPAGGAPVNLGEIAVAAGARAVGKVVNANGTPVAGATVLVTSSKHFYRDVLAHRADQDVFKNADQLGQTNANGEFSLTGLPPDATASYVVVAQHPRQGISTTQAWSAAPMTLALSQPGAIEGVWTVKGHVVSTGMVRLTRLPATATPIVYTAHVDPDGKFRFPVLPPGSYKFSNGATCVVSAGEITTVALATTSAN